MAQKDNDKKEEKAQWDILKERRKAPGVLRRLTPEEREKLREEIEENPEGEIEKGEIELLEGNMVFDVMTKAYKSRPHVGDALMGAPLEMEMILDFTGLRGSGSNIYHSLIYQLPKWSYSVKKVDEGVQVSPVYADLYNLIIGQKQKLEASIKTGLTSAAQAVADYELLSHDARRYGEMLDYFKAGQKDEHVLRSLFIDRVDAFTGESYSMIGMAKRWPTIITDFIRMGSPEYMGETWDDVKKIHERLDVSMAEATVLKTKDRLFREWTVVFLPAVKQRFARVQALLQARKKSVDEYRNWLKPYIAKYKVMKESDEDNPALWVSDAYTTPGFGQSEALVTTRLWVWKAFRVWESHKPASYKESGKHKGWVLYPYDDFVKRWLKRIEYKYGVRIEEADARAVLDDASSKKGYSEVIPMLKDQLYYLFFDMKMLISLLRTPPPEGMESDNLMLVPLKAYYISQNVLLLLLLEMKARESQIVHYIDELIGSESLEREIYEHVESQFLSDEERKKRDKLKASGKPVPWGPLAGPKERCGSFSRNHIRKHNCAVMRLVHLFIRQGPYEPIFYERVSKMYSRPMGIYYSQVVSFIKEKMSVGK